jgi:hypothetical protein
MTKDLSRLKELVEVVLPAVPEDSFSLEFWAKIKDCRTVYCACGWAAEYQPFKEAGLSLTLIEQLTHTFELVYQENKNTKYTGYKAASKFFNIPLSQAFNFFDPDSYSKGTYTTKAEVIERITSYLKEV